jgi:NAD(P)-dependent dehydrogenase (short-subunit alcohol dehydrogenase family)
VVADIDPEQGKQTVERVRADGGRAMFVRADVRVGDDLHNQVEVAERTYQGLDILVNNAGGGGHVEPHFPVASPSQWRATLDLNLRAAMLATQLALAPMRQRGAGAVVNVASTAGVADAVVECICDDRLAGRVMVLWREQPRRLLDPG